MQVKTKKKPFAATLQAGLDNARPVLWQLAIAAFSAMCSAAQVYGSLRPLGIAMAAGAVSTWSLSAAAGAAIGYALSMDITSAAPYLCAICAVAIIRTVLTAKRLKDTAFAGIIGALVLLVSKCLLGIAQGFGFAYTLSALIEAILCVGSAYLIKEMVACGAKAQDKWGESLSVAGYVMLLLAASSFSIGGIYLSRIISGVIILCCAYKGRQSMATVLGIAGAAALTAVSPIHATAAIGVAAGGLCAAALAQGERLASCAMFIGVGFIGILAQDTPQLALKLMMELCCAGAVFLLIPERLLAKGPARDEGEARRAAATELSGRVSELAESLGDIGCTIGEVFDKLPKKGESYADICAEVANKVCVSCNRRMFCWVDCYSDTMGALSELSTILSRGIAPVASDLPELMQRRCVAPDKLTAGLAREYEGWRSRKELRYQGELMRAALTEQYGSIAAALQGFGEKLWREDAPDEKKAARINALFDNLGVSTLSARVAVDKDGRMHTSIKLPRLAMHDDELKVIAAEIGDICHRKFEPPQVKQTTGYTMLDFYEKAIFEPHFGVYAIAAKEGVSGDAVRNFCDSYGNAHAILCDGMGTGKAAAVDGLLAASLTSRLIRAGFAAREAARLVNVALALKSEEEAGAALDILSVNLYTGVAGLFKAGGAGSYLLHDGKVKRLGQDSLPIGILGDVVSREDTFTLSRGDTAVLVSDGAVADGDEWLCQQLELTCGDTASELCRKAANAAVRRSSSRPDDITVLALRLV